MSRNARERDVARSFGFDRPRLRLPIVPTDESARPARELVDRLGVRAGMRVALLGVDDVELRRVAAGRTSRVTTMAPRGPVDLIVYQADTIFALRRLGEFAQAITPAGALWVLWPRGQEQIKQAHVQRAGLGAGLVDTKITSVSERLSGLKFVHRLADR